MKILRTLLMLFAAVNIMAQSNVKIEMPAVFSDNMIVQQKSNAALWGKTKPNVEVNIAASWGSKSKVKSNQNGDWIAKLKTPNAGGPHEIKIKVGDSTLVLKDVLAGEVWLCSGQSNMEMPLRGFGVSDSIIGSAKEIDNANNSKIRMFTAAHLASPNKQFSVSGSWQKLAKETAPFFSATAYFFGKKLFEELKVPIGLIHTSWGGTPIEAWIDAKYLEEFPNFKKTIDSFVNAEADFKVFEEWINQYPKINIPIVNGIEDWRGISFNDIDCSQAGFDDSNWGSMSVPAMFERTNVGEFDGAIWFRKSIEIPQNWNGKELILKLGPIDDCDITFVNGVKIGGYEEDGSYQKEREYTIPKELVRDSKLTIAVRVLDFRGGGGIYGSKEKLNVRPIDSNESEAVSIAGEWKYLPVAQIVNREVYILGDNAAKYFSRPKVNFSISSQSPTALYNGMIAPFVPFTFKGAIWYQGEANTGRAEEYKKLMPALVNCWRNNFSNGDFPFYYVQIAPYKYGDGANSQLLREAQLFSQSIKNSGMAVTLDISNTQNIHPANKKDVGYRLAFWALAKNYGKKIPYSGPAYKSMKSENGKITLKFEYLNGGLVLNEINSENNFLIAGEDKVFKKAVVINEGKILKVYNHEIPNPVAVRYAWTDTSEATLFNKAGLPASSFRTDNWSE